MKNFVLIIMLFAGVICSYGQENKDFKFTVLHAGYGLDLEVFGENSALLTNQLFEKFPNKKRKGYIWKFRKVEIPGLSQKITLQVHEGVHGKTLSANGEKVIGGYFHTFSNAKYKSNYLTNLKSTEEIGLIIYLKKGRKHVVKTDEELILVKNYLNNLK